MTLQVKGMEKHLRELVLAHPWFKFHWGHTGCFQVSLSTLLDRILGLSSTNGP